MTTEQQTNDNNKFREIDALCDEVDSALHEHCLKGLKIPNHIVMQMEKWLEETKKSNPWHHDPRILALPHFEIVDDCAEYFRRKGHAVVAVDANAVYKQKIKPWQDSKNRNSITFMKGFNRLDLVQQQSIYASWLNSALPGNLPRLIISIFLFTEEFDQIEKYDLWDKLSNLSIIVNRGIK